MTERGTCHGCGNPVSLEASQASERLRTLGPDVYTALATLYGVETSVLRLCAECFVACYGSAIDMVLAKR